MSRFILEVEGPGYRLRPIQKRSGEVGDGWHVDIEMIGIDEIEVTPQHGFKTVFRRKTEPNPDISQESEQNKVIAEYPEQTTET